MLMKYYDTLSLLPPSLPAPRLSTLPAPRAHRSLPPPPPSPRSLSLLPLTLVSSPPSLSLPYPFTPLPSLSPSLPLAFPFSSQPAVHRQPHACPLADTSKQKQANSLHLKMYKSNKFMALWARPCQPYSAWPGPRPSLTPLGLTQHSAPGLDCI